MQISSETFNSSHQHFPYLCSLRRPTTKEPLERGQLTERTCQKALWLVDTLTWPRESRPRNRLLHVFYNK